MRTLAIDRTPLVFFFFNSSQKMASYNDVAILEQFLSSRMQQQFVAQYRHAMAEHENTGVRLNKLGGIGSTFLKSTLEGFEIVLDLKDFSPTELAVQLHRNILVVEGTNKDEEEAQDILITQQFIRKFKIPDNIDLLKLSAFYSDENILTVRAPKIETDQPHCGINEDMIDEFFPSGNPDPARRHKKNKKKKRNTGRRFLTKVWKKKNIRRNGRRAW